MMKGRTVPAPAVPRRAQQRNAIEQQIPSCWIIRGPGWQMDNFPYATNAMALEWAERGTKFTPNNTPIR